MPDTESVVEEVVVWASRPPTDLVGGGGGTEWVDPAASRTNADLESLQQVFVEECAQNMSWENATDDDFIYNEEGGDVANGYVPSESSGVTIGAGVDLGQRNVGDLQNLRLGRPLINILTPYLGLQGQAARDYLASNSLTLHPQVRRNLNVAVHNQIYNQLYRNFDDNSSMSFFRLPGSIQTAIASIAMQYGPGLDRPASEGGAPRYFDAVTEGRWRDAVNELRDFGDDLILGEIGKPI